MSSSKPTGLLDHFGVIDANSASRPQDDDRPTLARGILLTILLTSFVAAAYGFGIYLFSQLVSDMRADLGFAYTTVGTMTAVAQIGFLVFALAASWLTPRIGGGEVVLGSMALCGTCLVLLPMAEDVLFVGVLLAILGGTAASVWIPMVEIVARTIGYRHRAKVLGLISSGTSYGVFVNSLLVPVYVPAGDWRDLWQVVGVGTLSLAVVGLLAFRHLGLLGREPETPTVTTGASPQSRKGWRTAISETRAVIVPWVLLIWGLSVLSGFSTLPFQNYLSPYLREELGFGVDFAALAWGTIGFVGMFSGFLMGALADRTSMRLALLISCLFFFASALILTLAPTGWLPIVAGCLFAMAFYPVFGLIPAYVAKRATAGTATIIFGVANVILGTGGMIGNALGGILKDQTGTFVWIYAIIAGSVIVMAMVSVALPRESGNEAA